MGVNIIFGVAAVRFFSINSHHFDRFDEDVGQIASDVLDTTDREPVFAFHPYPPHFLWNTTEFQFILGSVSAMLHCASSTNHRVKFIRIFYFLPNN